MPPKAKKKRASLTLDAETGQIKESESTETPEEKEKAPPVRQVVEVVEDSGVPQALETIKEDVQEIEDAVETIEETVTTVDSPQEQSAAHEASEAGEKPELEAKANVESLFVKSEPGVAPEITVVDKRGPSLGVWVGAMLGVALAIGVSLIVFVRGPQTLPFFAAKPTPTPTAAPKPTPSPSPSLSKADITVSVLNGGGVPGAGSKMKAFLEQKGYTVVSVGNAKEYTYQSTEIHTKPGKSDYAALLSADLKADYSLGSSSASVDADASYDVQVIVGKEE